MRWFFAAVLFALAVALAITTAALRADNARYRHAVEVIYRSVGDRLTELRRLSVQKLAEATPERLAALHWAHLRREAERRLEGLQ